MAELSDEQRRKMKQSMVDAANMDGDDSGDINASVNRVFGGGRLQEQLGLGNKPATRAEDAAAIRNSDLSNPDSVASVRRALPDNAAIVQAKEKLAEMQQQRPDWANANISGQAEQMNNSMDAEDKKQRLLNALKQQRGY